MKKLYLLLLLPLLLAACSSHDDEEPTPPAPPAEPTHFDRTVLVYISGENRLSGEVNKELEEMRTGTKNIGANALVIYVDKASTSQKPYLVSIRNGVTRDSIVMNEDTYASDPNVMLRVLRQTAELCPANSYGLVLWGHASGWLIEDSIAYETLGARSMNTRRAYGVDNGRNSSSTDAGKWMNIYTLGSVLRTWNKPIDFIFADCCQFQCVETAFELRDITDYIIGSPAEIPGKGAPYDTMVPEFWNKGDSLYKGMVDAYYAQTDTVGGIIRHTLLSVIKTTALDTLAQATHSALATLANPVPQAIAGRNLIYYRGGSDSWGSHLSNYDIMYDMNDYMMQTLSDSTYNSWKAVLDRVVVYKKLSKRWMTAGQIDFKNFTMTNERYGGMSMFIPQNRPGTNYPKCNEHFRKTAWYQQARLEELGW